MNFEDLRFEVEEATGLLPCVADSLSVLHEELEHNLCLRENSTGGMGCYLRLCSPMHLSILELDRIKNELDSIIAKAYEQKKEEE